MTHEENGTLVLEEAKSGAVGADDRWTLWRRVRRTVAALGAAADARRVQVRLTVNAEQLPSSPENWRSLPTQSQLVNGAWATPQSKDEHRRSVRSAADLANEAIHVLTSVDADATSAPLTLQDARTLLSRFDLNDQHSPDSAEEDVRHHLAILSRNIGVEELLNAVRGEVARRAESEDPARRTFAADELLRSLSILERLASVEPDTLRCWQTLRAHDNSVAANEDFPTGLAYQDWKAVQPHVRDALEASSSRPVALLGRGGIGKSVLLQRWLDERRVAGDDVLLLAGTDIADLAPRELASALDLGAFHAHHRDRRLAVAFDALENATDDKRMPALLSALRAAASGEVSVCVTCRLVEWRSARGTAERVQGWQELELAEWPEDRVREQIGASGRPRVKSDLLRLLRTPLLLDLFLRTFGPNDAVPPGLETRHGLLQAYWDRRILPADDERSADRRVLLLELAKAEAGGITAHTVVDEAARALTSEGLLVLARGGLRQFRHALLRDFAMGEWARGVSGAAERGSRLASIRPGLSRFGALRACLEAAAVEQRGQLTTFVGAVKPPLLFSAATVLGEFEDAGGIDFAELVDAVSPAEREPFLRALLLAIKLESNASWASTIARLRAAPAWVAGTHWITAPFITQLVDVLEGMSARLDPADAVKIAHLLRTWTLVPRVGAEIAAQQGYAHGRLFKLLSKIDPSPDTVSWLVQLDYRGSWTRFWVLSELHELVARMVSRQRAIDGAALRAVYAAAAGLRDDAGRLRADASVPSNETSGYARIERSLIGVDKSTGLIDGLPSTFVGVAVDLIAGHEADDADEREERLRDLKARWPAPKLIEEPNAEVRELEDKARRAAGGTLTSDAAGAGLIVDNPADPYWQLLTEHEHLLLHLRGLAENSLASDGLFFDTFFWPAIAKSRSALARACVLDLLTKTAPCGREDILDELLRDGRLYFLRAARFYLQRALRVRWSSLHAQDRGRVLENIRASGREPAGNIYLPGPLLAAIPDNARPDELRVFLELFRVHGWELEIEETRPITVGVAREPLSAPDTWKPIEGLSEADQEPWRLLAAWDRARIEQASDDRWSDLVALVESIVARSLPSPASLISHPELVERLAEFCNAHADPGAASRRPVRVDPDSLQRLARWSISALDLFAAADLHAGCGPLDSASVGLPPKAELWMNFAFLADAVLWERSLRDDVPLNHALFDAVDRVTLEAPARLTWNVLVRVRGWFRANGRGRDVLWAVLTGRTRNGRALTAGLRFLKNFSRAEQKELIEGWLTEAQSPPVAPARQFAREIGQYLGWAALMRHEGTGEPTGAYDIIDKLLAAPSKFGVLSDPAVHALFVGQSVFGAKQALSNGGVPFDRADEFVARMQRCWSALLPCLEEEARRDMPAFALWVFHPILDGSNEREPPKLVLDADERLAWWRALKPVAMAVVREGPSREVNSFMRCLKGSPLLTRAGGGEVLDLVRALQARLGALTPEVAGYHWHDAVACAAAVVESVMANTTHADVGDELYEAVAGWAAPPLANEDAGAVARRLRG